MQGGTNQLILHMTKALSPYHQITINYLDKENYYPKFLPKKWRDMYRIPYLRRISKDRQFDRFDMVITLQPDSHCIRHKNHIIYFQHHTRQFYDLFGVSLNQRKKLHKKLVFIFLTSLVRMADTIYLNPNLRNSHLLVNSQTVGLRLMVYNRFSNFNVLNPGCDLPERKLSKKHLNHNDISNKSRDKFQPILLSFSRLDLIQKGLTLILDTALLLPDYKFIIAGPRDSMISNIDTSRFPNVRLIIKNFSDEEKDELFRTCDVYLAPYLNEDFGITPLEANAHGKPVVYCNDSGEIVNTQKHKITGYMCKRNTVSLVSGIEHCVLNKEKMKDMCVKNALAYTWEDFEASFREYLELQRPKY